MKKNRKKPRLLVLGFIIVLLSLIVAVNFSDFRAVQEHILKKRAGLDITLKDGELYKMGWIRVGSKITSTGGKISSYLVSPDKRYVAYSIIVGYREEAGDDESAAIAQVPVHYIVVMDLKHRKQLTVIKPVSENEPYIHIDRWISREELLVYDADGIVVGREYIYNASTDQLRRADMQAQVQREETKPQPLNMNFGVVSKIAWVSDSAYDSYWGLGLQAWADPVVEIMVITPNGQKTGYDPSTGTEITEISRAYYTEESEPSVADDEEPKEPLKLLSMHGLTAGNYILKIFGAGKGPYSIHLRSSKGDQIKDLSPITGMASPGMRETYRIRYAQSGEISVTKTNQPPIARAGNNQTVEQGYEVTLDGSDCNDPDGDPLTYSWSIISKPEKSSAVLSDANTARTVFTPDVPGTYFFQLVVSDYFIDSVPAMISIIARPKKSAGTP